MMLSIRTNFETPSTIDYYKTMVSFLLLSRLMLLSAATIGSVVGLHIGLICPGHHGHLNPTATLGAELQRRGHQVTLISTSPGSVAAERHGLEFQPIGVPEYESGVLQLQLAQEGRLRGLSAFWHTIRLFRREQQILLRDLPGVLVSRNIDAICVDQLLPAAMDVADAHGIQSAVLCNALPLHLDSQVPPFVTTWGPSEKRHEKLRNRAANMAIIVAASPFYIMLNKYRTNHGLTKHTPASFQKGGRVQVTQIPSFVDFPRTNLPPHFFYSRPWHKANRDVAIPFPWDRLNDDRPIVYASLGSVQTGLQSLYLNIAQACASLNVQLVLSLGRKGASLPSHTVLPSNAIVVDFAPQLQLLQRASIVLTHAGLNTALEALSFGLPIVTVPLCNDQPGIAARLVHLGVAHAVPPGRATPPAIQQAISKVLEDPSYQRAATRYQRMIDRCPTLSQTAEILETALSRSGPLLRDDPEVTRILSFRPMANLTLSVGK